MIAFYCFFLLPQTNYWFITKGPYEVREIKGDMHYKIDIGGNLETFHANMLMLYIKRQSDNVEKGS